MVISPFFSSQGEEKVTQSCPTLCDCTVASLIAQLVKDPRATQETLV